MSTDVRSRILVVEDHHPSAVAMCALLEADGCAVTVARNGLEGLAAAADGPDLILLDLMMPGIDGYEVCRRLKASPATQVIPVVLCTALNSREDRIHGLEAGADDFLTKPVDRAELRARIRAHVRLKRLYDETIHQAELLAAEKSRAEGILASIGDGVLATDLTCRTTLVNPACLAIAGVTSEATLGRVWHEALGVRDAAGVALTAGTCPLREVLNGGQPVTARDLVIGRSDGCEVVVSLTAAPVRGRDGVPVGVVAVLRDVTREREVERMKSEFASLVSHELRTPMTSVLGFSELLLFREKLSELGREMAEAIYRESQRLTNLINDFLDVQRLESGAVSYDYRPLRLDETVADVRRTMATQLDRHRLVWDSPDEPVLVAADQDRLTQVLVNLLSNAVKYSPAGGEIHVTARCEGKIVVIAVADQGLGIPPEAMPRLFQKFYRVEEREHRAIGGTGLGLAICKQIVEGMGGRIWAESPGLGRGSAFKVALPRAE